MKQAIGLPKARRSVLLTACVPGFLVLVAVSGPERIHFRCLGQLSAFAGLVSFMGVPTGLEQPRVGHRADWGLRLGPGRRHFCYDAFAGLFLTSMNSPAVPHKR